MIDEINKALIIDEINKALTGLKIKSIFANLSRDSCKGIQIQSDDRHYELRPIGDCCSESWIEHIDLPSPGEVIQSFEEIEIDRTSYDGLGDAPNGFRYENGHVIDENGEEHECLEQYFYKIKTDKGSYDIEMRNSSNGYYGGGLELYEIDA